MELNIALVDDMPSDIARLRNYIYRWFNEGDDKPERGYLKSYGSGEELLRNFEPKMFQIVFMDILMEKVNGVETARKLREADTELLVVFITTSREFVFETFRVHPFEYILKPYSREKVNEVLNEAVRVLTADDPEVTVRVSQSEYKIPVRKISAVVSQGHAVEIILTDGKCMLTSQTFKEMENLFAEDSRFLLCNRGIILNMSQISAQGDGVFIMKNGARYPIRVRGQAEITRAFSQYVIRNMRADSLSQKEGAEG